MTPDFTDVQVGASRTHGAWRHYPAVREVEALHVAAIASAKRIIYMENQYFTAPLIAEALAVRLREKNGPEVVLISTQHSPSYFDQATMDKTRLDFIAHLKRADVHDRFRAYSPVTTLGLTIIVHAKLTIIDDVLLRLGRPTSTTAPWALTPSAIFPLRPVGRSKLRRRRRSLSFAWVLSPTGLDATFRP